MTAVQSGQTSRRRKSISLAVFLFAFILLFAGSFAAAQAHAYAAEPELSQNEQTTGQEDNESASVPVFEINSFDNHDIIEAQTNQSDQSNTVIIPSSEAPLAGFPEASEEADSAGSILNTVLAGISVLSLIMMLYLLLVRKTHDYRVIMVRILAVAFGMVTIVAWSLFDRLQIPFVMLNSSSALVITLFSVYVVMAVFSYFYETRLNRKKALGSALDDVKG